ncbi:trehalose-6-phosphate synthase [Dactylosporangium sp. CA-092794]|uniref:trehalose-6-phosphate synthase n=1 Tax=Dactylosporangium sp. CA-092794 TaxID=3239929 RepID=UPI003D8C574E
MPELPGRAEVLRGLLGADLVGFPPTPNFLQLTRVLLDLRPDGDRVEAGGRTVTARAFTISIGVKEIDRLAADPAVRDRARRLRQELGEFTGSAAELGDAFLANPHDVADLKRGVRAALRAGPDDRATRMRAMRAAVLSRTVDDWAREFLDALQPARSDAGH